MDITKTLEAVLFEIRSYKERAERAEQSLKNLTVQVAEHQLVAGPLVKGCSPPQARELHDLLLAKRIVVTETGDILGVLLDDGTRTLDPVILKQMLHRS